MGDKSIGDFVYSVMTMDLTKKRSG